MWLISGIYVTSFLVAGCWAAQPSVPKPVKARLRDLPWSSQINFLHTTDTHGWHAGHLQEASFNADWGDYISFSHHLRQRADDDGSDLLLVDTGDKVEGNGLYDSSEPKGNYTYKLFKEQDIDVIVCGNHELYKQNTSEAEYKHIIPHYKDNYIASNIDIIDPKSGKRVPLAQRFRKFKTKNQGMQIMAFGFLFDFKGSSNHAFVQSVEDAINEAWFQDAIRDRSVDLFVVAGHSAVRSKEFSLIFDQIRKQQWDTPIMFFGGHYHIRDYKKYDSKSYGLASGRYMETIGFQSISGMALGGEGDASKALAEPVFSRLYIDNNLHSLHHHSNKSGKDFATPRGTNVTNFITNARKELGLDQRYGCAPRDLWTNRAPYPDGEGSESSIYTWLEKEVIPEMVWDERRADKAKIVMANTGTMRFDVFKGAFTRDTTFLIQPFTNGFRYIADVDFDKASKLLSLLNSGGQIIAPASADERHLERMLLSSEQYGRRMLRYHSTQLKMRSPISLWPHQKVLTLEKESKNQYPLGTDQVFQTQDDDGPDPDATPGYTTVDDAGDDGDDTRHSPIDFFAVPNAFESRINITKSFDSDEEPVDKVDVVFIDFIQPWILSGLKYLGAEYTANDTLPYADLMDFTTMISTWVSKHWNETDC